MKVYLQRFKSINLLGLTFLLTMFSLVTQAQVIVQVGTGTASNTNQALPAPYQNYFWGSKQQFLILKSELNALGISAAAPITSLGFNVSALGSTPLGGYKETFIRLKNVTYNAFTGTWETGLTQVFYAATFTPSLGWNMHTFSTPFSWDGTSNIVVEVCNNDVAWTSTSNASVFNSTTSFASAMLYQNDASGVCGSPGTVTSTFDRCNMRLIFNNSSSVLNLALYNNEQNL